MREQLIDEAHRGLTGGHFSGARIFHTLSRRWWWDGMYGEVMQQVKRCPECAIVSGGGKVALPPLHPIPVQRPFQILAVDMMDLPTTSQENQHVIVFQDYLTKWPMVYAILDQKAHRVARLLVEEIVPFFSVAEASLSDRGANLLSHLMRDVCSLLGIKKLNTTAYHPQCNGMVERFNRLLKMMLRKHAARFGLQWTVTSLESCGRIVTRHTTAQGRSHRFSCLGWISVPPQRRPCFLPSHWNRRQWKTTAKN